MASIIQYDHDSSLSASAASSAVKTYADSRHTSKSLKVLKSAPADSTNIARVYIVPGSASRIDIDSDTAGETRGSRPNSHGRPDATSTLPSTSSYTNAGYLVLSDPQKSDHLKAFAENVGHQVPEVKKVEKSWWWCTIL